MKIKNIIDYLSELDEDLDVYPGDEIWGLIFEIANKHNEPRLAGDAVKKAVIENNVQRIFCRRCSLCNYAIHYEIVSIEPEDIILHRGCNCVKYIDDFRASFAMIANDYNIQKTDEGRVRIVEYINGKWN